jgi:putative FmdB family regulatory protein
MPIYEFVCEQCGRRFRERMSPVEHYQNRPQCPDCHAEESVHGAPPPDIDVNA